MNEFKDKPDFDDRKRDGNEGEEYREGSSCHELNNVVDVRKNIWKTVVYLEPDLEIRFLRGLNDESKCH